MERILRKWALFFAIVIGFIIHPWVEGIAFLSPYFISVILMLTFSKLSLKDLNITKVHLLFLALQLVVAALLYFSLAPYSPIVAAGAMVIVLVPTATSAPALVKMLDGNVAYVTSYLFLSNIVMALVFPLVISLVGESGNVDFSQTFFAILSKVGSLLICPLVIATLVRKFWPSLNKKMVEASKYSFYLWALTLTIVVGNTIRFISVQEHPDYLQFGVMMLVSILICIFQFWVGRRIGERSGEKFTAGQTLGQKNTILAIWLVQTFLNPLASIVPACYVIWQNLFNSYEMFIFNNKLAKRSRHISNIHKVRRKYANTSNSN